MSLPKTTTSTAALATSVTLSATALWNRAEHFARLPLLQGGNTVVLLAMGGGSDSLTTSALRTHLLGLSTTKANIQIVMVVYESDLKALSKDDIDASQGDGRFMIKLGGKAVPLPAKIDQQTDSLVFERSIERQHAWLLVIPSKSDASSKDTTWMPEAALHLITAMPGNTAFVFGVDTGGDSILPSLNSSNRDVRVATHLLSALPQLVIDKHLPPICVRHVVVGPGSDGETSDYDLEQAFDRHVLANTFLGRHPVPPTMIQAMKSLGATLGPSRTINIVVAAAESKGESVDFFRPGSDGLIKHTKRTHVLNQMVILSVRRGPDTLKDQGHKLLSVRFNSALVDQTRAELVDNKTGHLVPIATKPPAQVGMNGMPIDTSRLLQLIVEGKFKPPYQPIGLTKTGEEVLSTDPRSLWVVCGNRTDLENAQNNTDEKWTGTAAMGPNPGAARGGPRHIFFCPAPQLAQQHPLTSINLAMAPATNETRVVFKDLRVILNKYVARIWGDSAVERVRVFVHLLGDASMRYLHIHVLYNDMGLGHSYYENLHKEISLAVFERWLDTALAAQDNTNGNKQLLVANTSASATLDLKSTSSATAAAPPPPKD